jgi:hypothetical protein
MAEGMAPNGVMARGMAEWVKWQDRWEWREWRNGGMAEWRNGGMAEWRNGEWSNGGNGGNEGWNG